MSDEDGRIPTEDTEVDPSGVGEGAPRLGAVLSISEAAQACGMHRNSIQRRVTGKVTPGFPNAYRDSEGVWRIPVADLVAAGLSPNAPAPPLEAEEAAPASTSTNVVVQRIEAPVGEGELDRLRAENTDLRHRLDLAQQRAALEEKRADDLSRAVRALTAGTPAEPQESAAGPDTEDREIRALKRELRAVEDEEPQRRRGFWDWLLGN